MNVRRDRASLGRLLPWPGACCDPGAAEQAVTQRPRHPGLSGGAQSLLLSSRHLQTLGLGGARSLAAPPGCSALLWTGSED